MFSSQLNDFYTRTSGAASYQYGNNNYTFFSLIQKTVPIFTFLYNYFLIGAHSITRGISNLFPDLYDEKEIEKC